MTKTDKNPYEATFRKEYEADWSLHSNYIQTFDAFEAMLIGQVYDAVSASVDSSKITDSYATTLAIERAARVMGKLPDGVVEAMAKADAGKAAFMDILRQKWIYPNCNSQHNFDTKLRLWQLYSSVYGYMPMFYDWNVSPSGYVGPDCWLWNPRNLVPQQGRTSIGDMDYVTALTWVSKEYLEDIRDETNSQKTMDGGWNKDAIISLLEAADTPTSVDTQKDTFVARKRTPNAVHKGICLATRYEAGEEGEWVTFAPDHSSTEIRRIKNPHKNGRIPFVIKYSQPLFDSFYGLGDFQRSRSLMAARDGLTNFYFKGIKMNLIPPIIANANGVVKHTLDYREGAVMLETIPNSIRRLETSNAGLATFQAAQSNLTGSLLSLFGTQNASLPGADTLNPSQGKTPAAIDLYSGKEADRDGQERMYLEGAIEVLTDGFFSLVANIGTEDIPVNLFSDDIEAINEAGLTDVLGLFTGKFQPNQTQTGGELKIDPAKLKNTEYRFNITSGSTAKLSKQKQLGELQSLMDNIAKFQNQFKDDQRIDVNWGEVMKAYQALTDVPGASKFVTVKDGPTPQEAQLQAEIQKLQAQAQLQQQPPKAPEAPKQIVNYKDAPEDIKRQMEGADGYQPSQQVSPAGTDQALKHHQIINSHEQTTISAAQADQAQAQAQQPQPPAEPTPPNYVGGKAFTNSHTSAAAKHIGSL